MILLFYKCLKCEFVDCRQSKNNYVLNFRSILYLYALLMCATVFNLYNVGYSLYTSVRAHTNCSVDLYNSDLQTTTVFFTRNFTQGWLNSNYSSSALSCPFIVQHKQSNERSRSRTFVFSLSREFHRDRIIVCGLWTYCCLYVRHTWPSFFSHSYCWCFTRNVFNIFISAYLSCIKWYFIVSIFVTLFNSYVFDIRQY